MKKLFQIYKSIIQGANIELQNLPEDKQGLLRKFISYSHFFVFPSLFFWWGVEH